MTEGLEGVIGEGVVEVLQIVRNLHTMHTRAVLKEEGMGGDEGDGSGDEKLFTTQARQMQEISIGAGQAAVGWGK